MNVNIGIYFFLGGFLFCSGIYVYLAKKKSEKLDKEIKIKKQMKQLSIYI